MQSCRGAPGESEPCRPLLGSWPGANLRRKRWAHLEMRVCVPGVGVKPSSSFVARCGECEALTVHSPVAFLLMLSGHTCP